MEYKLVIRGVLAAGACILIFLLLIDIGALAMGGGSGVSAPDKTVSSEQLQNSTIISSQTGEIYIASSGDVIASAELHDQLFDVDIVNSIGEATVLYAGVDKVSRSECPLNSACIANHVGIYNLTTGEQQILFSQTIPSERSPQWHDADYIGDNRVVVADMSRDRVFIVNTSTGIITWQWQAQQHFRLTSGADNAQDWTHLNDVELLDDGRLMISMRNQDRVIFISQKSGVDSSWTLGEEEKAGDKNKILYEQHNPDFIPREHGGPAVLVADSEQNRIVEFSREEGSWSESWSYSVGLDWPRDADRLPNGHTLITDSRNARVIEIDEENDIIRQTTVPIPYEAERFGTRAESTGGPAASQADLDSLSETSNSDSFIEQVEGILPPIVVNTVSFVISKYPTLSLSGFIYTLSLALCLVLWGVLEWRWSSYEFQSPVHAD